MVQRDLIPKEVMDEELYILHKKAAEAARPEYPYTPYGATKTAELNVQFSIDPSYGLSRERYAWFSDSVFFDKSNFDTTGSRIQINTNADGASSARIRSAYPGQYVSHTLAEPGLGAELAEKDVEYDEDGFVSLTHGEISLEVSSIDTDQQVGINAHGISFEPDATYHQVRVDGENVAFVPQSEWNIDKMDGNGPSGKQLRPEDGYVYQFIYTWYGEGAMILAIQDPESSQIIPVNEYIPSGPDKPPVTSPNLPIQALIENQGTADSLHLTVGGMQFATHGVGENSTTTRTTQEARHSANGFISDNVALTDESVDPFSTTLSPLVAATRNTEREVEKGLRFELDNVLLDADSPCYVFVFDEFDDTTIDGTFSPPRSRSGQTDESRILTNTTCTTYTPGDNAVVRGFTYIPSSKKDPAVVAQGDTSSRIPLRSTVVIAAALAPGANATTADPIITPFREGF